MMACHDEKKWKELCPSFLHMIRPVNGYLTTHVFRDFVHPATRSNTECPRHYYLANKDADDDHCQVLIFNNIAITFVKKSHKRQKRILFYRLETKWSENIYLKNWFLIGTWKKMRCTREHQALLDIAQQSNCTGENWFNALLLLFPSDVYFLILYYFIAIT